MAIYEIKIENARLHVSQGNRKIGKGIWSFSTLPGNQDHLLYVKGKGLLTTVPGTCSKYCEGCAKDGCCYAWRDAKLHSNACIPAWGENTLLLREKPEELFRQIDQFITEKNAKYLETNDEKYHKVRIWRWHVSGEIESLHQLEMMDRIAVKHPEVRFSVYTKNYDVLERFLIKYGDKGFADNFIINVSEWHGVAKEFLTKYPNTFNVFEYDDSNLKGCELSEEEKARLTKVTHCPAVTKDGHHALNANGEPITCDHCQRCYTKTGKRTAVYAH